LVATSLPDAASAESAFDCAVFDRILARETWHFYEKPPDYFTDFAVSAKKILAGEGIVVMLESPPSLGQRLSDFITDITLRETFSEAEKAFFAQGRVSWGQADLEAAFEKAGFSVETTLLDQHEERLVTQRDLSHWFENEKSSWYAFVKNAVGADNFEKAHVALTEHVKEGPLEWRWKSALVTGKSIF
jgi:putative ATPase